MEPTSKEDFALALKTWRVRKGWSQRQMERETGISRYTIMRAESASRDLDWSSYYRLFCIIQAHPA